MQSVDELVSDPQAIASGAFVKVPSRDAASVVDGFNGVATPVDFSATPAGPAGPPPAIGEDADALLESLGIDAAARDRLRQAGVLAPVSGERQ